MTDATPIQAETQAERLVRAKQVQSAREQGIRAQAVKEGRQAREREILATLGTQTLQDASQLTQLRQERDARPTAQEEAKHGRHRFYQGATLGLIIGAALGCLAIFSMQGVIWDTATQAFREQAMTGAILSAGEREIPVPRRP